MKTFLILSLLSLYSLLSIGQGIHGANPTYPLVIAPAVGKPGTPYAIKTVRDITKYPLTVSGYNSFTTAIVSGALDLTVVSSGCVIAKGTRPTGTAPTCTTTAPGNSPAPSWISGFRYSYSGGLLTFEGAGPIGQAKFTPVSGGGFPTTNPDNVTINADQFYGYGPLANQSPYDKQWKLYYSGTALNVTLQQAGGSATYAYSVTPQNGANRIVLSGSTPTTPPPATPPTTASADRLPMLSYTDQGWSGGNEKQIENSEMVVKFDKSVGGVPTYAALKSNNRNLINRERKIDNNGNFFYDKGVEWQFGSDYSTPFGGPFQPFKVNGREVNGTGANPVPGGSDHPWYTPGIVHKSAIINDPVRGQVFCEQTRGLYWNFQNEPGHILLDSEFWLIGKTLAYRINHTVENRDPARIPEQRTFMSTEQENPCLYSIGDLNEHRVWLNGQEKNVRDGLTLGTFTPAYFSEGYWGGTYTADLSQGVTLYTPHNAAFVFWQKFANQGGEYDQASGYMKAANRMNYDNPGVYQDYGYIILAGKSEAQSIMATLPPPDTSFDFDFTGDNHRWWNEDAPLKRENGKWVWYMGWPNRDNPNSHGGRVMSPIRAWQASSINTIAFTMAVTGASEARLHWVKPGTSSQFEYRKVFPVIGDGVERTYTVSTADPNWNGLISTIGIQSTDNSLTSATIVLKRIRKVN